MKWRMMMVLSALVAVGLAAPAYGQEEEDDECECRWESRGPWRVSVGEWPTSVYFGGRARLGIWVDSEADRETNEIGARVLRVMEGGPADKAGIRDGDIITKLDGRSLLEGSESYDDDESAPAMRLLERARKLDRGDEVEVEFRRDSETRTVELVAGEFDNDFVAIGDINDRVRVMVDRLRELPRVELRGPDVEFLGPESFAVRVGSAFPGLQLVSVNPDLGEYFGVDEGVLVLSAPEEGELNLKAGDVILSIDGRDVRSPSHAMRILRSYNADEEVSFQIRRKNRTETVTGTMPEGLDHRVIDIHRRDDN